MLNKIILICCLLSFFACQQNSPDPEDVIVNKWRLISLNGENVQTNEGLQFAPNKQFFVMDSQGKAIPKLMEKIWAIQDDTLVFIDYNYEPKLIPTKGTSKFIINSLTHEKLDITLIDKENHHYIYKPFKHEDN